MEIKYKLYPYPVLTDYSDDYKTGKFEVAMNPVKDGYNIRLEFQAELTSEGLKNQIQLGFAKYVYHIECAQTGFRTVCQTIKEKESCILSNKLVSGKVQVCSFVVATEDISGFSVPDFHDDYEGCLFDIEAGCVMAVGRMITIDVSKDIDELAQTPSIFNIVRNADATCKQMLVDMADRKIVIKLPMDDYYSYKSLRQTPQAQAILNALTIIPALTYVLGELKCMSPDERQENTDALWYRVLKKSLKTQFDCEIESEEFTQCNSIELAQKLINDPLPESFKMLSSEFGVLGGEDE